VQRQQCPTKTPQSYTEELGTDEVESVLKINKPDYTPQK
jgi:hypothetical protein